MQILSNTQLYGISGGEEETPFCSFNPCSIAVMNFLKSRNDLLEALLSQDVDAQLQSSADMRHYQEMAVGNCSFTEIQDTGAVGCELFLL